MTRGSSPVPWSNSEGDKGTLEARHLAKTFPGDVPVHALVDASITIRPGDFVGIVGRSGSGKSTLLTLLGLLDTPTDGDLKIDGVDCSTVSPLQRDRLRARTLGFVFQAFNLVRDLSVYDNVDLALRYNHTPRRERPARIAASIDAVGLSHRLESRAAVLSGGEQQRLALARAIVKDPRIILADEPTGNLDSANEKGVVDLLRQITAGGTAVVIVTHSRDVASHCDRTYVMNDGILEPSQ